MATNTKTKARYILGLDGLRAFAVLAVIAYHLNLPFALGGFHGVTVFFVVSGYLITSLLMQEYHATQQINLKTFWLRRIKRLLPAMFFVLVVLNVLVPFLVPQAVESLHKDSIAALFYVNNWAYIIQDLSYFEQFNQISFLTHFWSLAIEEQFYIFWAILVVMVLPRKKGKNWLAIGTFVGAVASALWMASLYAPNVDPSRIYYGTDTRLFSLLIGAFFALTLPNYRFSGTVSRGAKYVAEGFGFFGLATFAYMIFFTNQYQAFTYQGGMVWLSFASVLTVLSLSFCSTTLLAKFLENNVLKWIGLRSYGIYLWHFPVLTFIEPKSFGLGFLACCLIGLLAAISYRFIENPLRKGQWAWNKKTTALLMVSLTLIVAANMTPTVEENKEEVVVELAPTSEALEPKDEKMNPLYEMKITAIGDSLLVNPSTQLKENVPNIDIHAQIGFQMWEAPSLVKQLNEQHALGDLVLIVLGSNGSFTKDTTQQLMDAIGKERLVAFVNVKVPRPWESIVNKDLKTIVKAYPNAFLIDWHRKSNEHDEYFLKDGTHTNETLGAKVFADFVENELKKRVAKEPN